MYIVIAGAGMIGGELAVKLLENKHDVVVIDRDKEICDKLYSETGVIAINGSVAHIETLIDANVGKADVVIAATGSDASNLAFAILSKSLGVPRITARMRNPAYEEAYRLAGVTSIVRVTDLMVNQMMMQIERPRIRRIMTIGGGRGEIFMVIVPQEAKIAGKTVEDVAKSSKFPSQCVFLAVYNQETDEFSIPRGKQIIKEGDELFLISSSEDIKQAADFLTT